MNTELKTNAKCYGVYDDNKIVAFMGVLHQPNNRNSKIKRVSRLVVLPDYQGIGIGYGFLCVIAKLYTNQGYDFRIVTSAKNVIYKLFSSPMWQMTRLSQVRLPSSKYALDYNRVDSMRIKCKTASFKYIGEV